MADPNNVAQYKYSAMSNLVLQADRRFTSRRGDDNTGDPESLAGRINVHEMGVRAARGTELPKKQSKPAITRGNIHEGEDVLERERKRKREREQIAISAADAVVEGLRYRPRTTATQQIYSLILGTVATNLGDVSGEVVRSAADAVLEYLKDDNLKDFDKKKEIDDLLGTNMSSKAFNELVNLGKKITDYNAQEDDEEAEGVNGEAEVDDRQGVAVVFDEEEEEDNNEVNEVQDAEDDSDDESESVDRQNANEAAEEEPMDGDDEAIILASGKTDSKAEEKALGVISIAEIDAYWLQRQVGTVFSDPHLQQAKTSEIMDVLSGETPDGQPVSLREIENSLLELFDYEANELVEKLMINRDRVLWVTRWRQAADNSEERRAVESAMRSEGHHKIVAQLLGEDKTDGAESGERTAKKMKLDLMDVDMANGTEVATKREGELQGGLQPRRLINLNNLVFEQGNHLMTNPSVKLPQGSTKRAFKGYEEIHVPPPKSAKAGAGKEMMPTSQMPAWAQPGFGSSKSLNLIQTQCYPSAFEGDGNMLICAPTGSGKTNVAMLTMLREIGKHRTADGQIMLDDFKIIYIAPLKALVQEQVGNFGKRLEPYGIRVAELTGDRQLTKQQIAETQLIVTTPEKWDVITRKATDASYTNLVRLIVIDEIHLLHDDRGPVLESIVSRTIRNVERTGDPVRIVGLSATLPNYHDVASFLRVDESKDLFHFDGSFRPCPLRQEFIGVTDKKPIKQLKTMNDICYTKVMDQVGAKRQQVLIFVHSRKETAKTARYIMDKAIELETIGQILKSDAASQEILREEAADIQDRDLKELLPYGLGIHHAGMSRPDRNSVEELFAAGNIQVLVCTATLAWGVNLPAHAVIIKGTQVYSPEKGSWVELSPQDVLQMLGRAGRPQYDTYGEGIIITTQAEIQYYLSLLNQQLPIESQFISRLADSLNAEIVLGSIRTRDEAVEWLGYTYLFVRMLRSPGLYSVGAEYEDDEALEQKRVDLIHSAATALEKSSLVKYDKVSGSLQATELGRVASHYYITHTSMLTYNQHILPSTTSIEFFRIFALSDEFRFIPVRQDEKVELAKLLGRVPVPVKEGVEEPQAKVNVLLQAYISRLKLEGLALMADMVYVTQSAGRILRAMFEIALKKGWSQVARTALDLCKMAEKRMWPTMTPLRQFPFCSPQIIQKAERIEVPWSSYFDLDPPRIGELLGMPKAGKDVYNLVRKFPKLELQAHVQPLTRSMLKVELTVSPAFEWDDMIHGAAESFWIVVEDNDGEKILYHDMFVLRAQYAKSDVAEHLVEFTVPMTDPLPPNYFISLISDRWMHSETKVAVSFQKLILPEKFPAHTQLLDLQPLPVSALGKYGALYPKIQKFPRIQTQTFNSLYAGDENVFVGAANGSGKTICAEFAILHSWSASTPSRIVYVAPFQVLVDQKLADWQTRLGALFPKKSIVSLIGDTAADLRTVEAGDLILATPSQWDAVSRQWQRRKSVQAVTLFIADDLHMIGGVDGYIYETVVSRMCYIALQTNSVRIVGLSASLANARDIGEWIGATKHTIYNFGPHLRAVPLELHLQSFTIPHFPSLMLAMVRPAYQAIKQHNQSTIVFVTNRKQSRMTASDLSLACMTDGADDQFLHADLAELQPLLDRVHEKALIEAITHGIGYYHEALSANDKKIVTHLYNIGALQVMVVSRDVAWEINNMAAHLVIVMGTQFFDGREHRYLDYPISDLLQMFGRARVLGGAQTCKGVLMTSQIKREYYKKFLNEALPVESQMHTYLHDAFVTEISSKTIGSTQDAVDWITYTYFYRRLAANPSYYGLVDVSNDGLSAYLSELVETTLKELTEAKIVELEEEDDTITSLNAAMIAAYYNISYITIQTFLLSLNAKTKLKGILEIVTSATEFENIQMRRHEEGLLRRIYDRLPVKMGQPSFDSPHFKAFVLLQAHFSRMPLPIDLAKDQEIILNKVLNLLSGCVDVLSSEGHLNAMSAMEMSQMVVQSMWDRDSPLLQIPHFTTDMVTAANERKVTDVIEFMETMSERASANELVKRLGVDKSQLAEMAEFANNFYPNIDMEFEVVDADDVHANAPTQVVVTLKRDSEEEEDDDDEESQAVSKTRDLKVHAPFFPGTKQENWWLVIGDAKQNTLLAIKRITMATNELTVKLEFVPTEVGKAELTLYLMCDSYVGVDQDPTFEVDVKEGEEEDEEEEGDEEEE